MNRFLTLMCSMVALIATGCNQTTTVKGGTSGSLHAGNIAAADFEIKVYNPSGLTSIGLGTTGPDGKFSLVEPNAAGPLLLPPGDFRFTLEYFGPEAVKIDKIYADVTKTLLTVKRLSETETIELVIPAFK